MIIVEIQWDIRLATQFYYTLFNTEWQGTIQEFMLGVDAYGNTEVYRLLGLAKYVSHQGSAPISITYKLDEKMPMEILKTSNQIVKIV